MLEQMSYKELKAKGKELELTFNGNIKKADLIDLIYPHLKDAEIKKTLEISETTVEVTKSEDGEVVEVKKRKVLGVHPVSGEKVYL